MLRQCPFDPVHVIQAYRYKQHILSCPKNPEKAIQEQNPEESTGNDREYIDPAMNAFSRLL